MAETKSSYTQFKEIYEGYKSSLGLAQQVRDNKVVPNIHALAAGILKESGLESLAKNLAESTERPDNHALLGIMQKGADVFGKKFAEFSKNQLVAIVNSTDLKRDKVIDALLLLPPEKAVEGYNSLSEIHKAAADFYGDLYLYQQNGKLSDDQKAAVIHNIKVRVLAEYQEKFKDDPDFFDKIGTLIGSYTDVAIAQHKGFTGARVKKFTEELTASDAGKYVEAMNLSDKDKGAFYQAILE